MRYRDVEDDNLNLLFVCGYSTRPDISLNGLDLHDRGQVASNAEDTLDFLKFLLGCGMVVGGNQNQPMDWLEEFFFPFSRHNTLGGFFGTVAECSRGIRTLPDFEGVILSGEERDIVDAELRCSFNQSLS